MQTAKFTFTERPIDWPLDALANGLHAHQKQSDSLTWLRQEHGNRVVTVTEPGRHAGAAADAAVTNVIGAQLLIRTADCVPIALESRDSQGNLVIGVVHAGWHGLSNGVIAAAVASMKLLGSQTISAQIGPCIGVECYEFGSEPLERLVAQFGDQIRGTTRSGTRALNMVTATRTALDQAGVAEVKLIDGWACTACDARRFYSHRARHDTGRLGLLAELVSHE